MTLPAVHSGTTPIHTPFSDPNKRAPSPNAHEDLSSTPSSPRGSNTSSLTTSPSLSRPASPAPNTPPLATQGNSRGTSIPSRLEDAGHRFLRNFQSILANNLASPSSSANNDPKRNQAASHWQTLTTKLKNAIDRVLGHTKINQASDNSPPPQFHSNDVDFDPYRSQSFEVIRLEQQVAPPSPQQHSLPPLFNPSTALRVDGGFGPDSGADSNGIENGPRYLHANQVQFSNSNNSAPDEETLGDFSLAQLPHSQKALHALVDRAICLHQKEDKIEPWVVMVNEPADDIISRAHRGLNNLNEGKPFIPVRYIDNQNRECKFNQPVFFVKAPLNENRCMTAESLIEGIGSIFEQNEVLFSIYKQNKAPLPSQAPPIFFSYAGVGRNAAMATLSKILQDLNELTHQNQSLQNLSDEDILEMMDTYIEAMRRDRGPLVIPNFDQYWEIACAIRQTVDRERAPQQNIA